MSMRPAWKGALAAALLVTAGAGCDDAGDGSGAGLGNNDPNVYVCLGDSLTRGIGRPVEETYPAQLGDILGKTVHNLGISGTRSGSGAIRIRSVLAKYEPGHVLVLYGANDLINGAGHESILANLRSMVREAKARGSAPVVGTLTPMIKEHARFGGSVETLNAGIKEMASQEGADVADLFAAFGKDETLLQDDGLHLTAKGARVVAGTFAAASSGKGAGIR